MLDSCSKGVRSLHSCPPVSLKNFVARLTRRYFLSFFDSFISFADHDRSSSLEKRWRLILESHWKKASELRFRLASLQAPVLMRWKSCAWWISMNVPRKRKVMLFRISFLFLSPSFLPLSALFPFFPCLTVSRCICITATCNRASKTGAECKMQHIAWNTVSRNAFSENEKCGSSDRFIRLRRWNVTLSST